MLQLHGLKQSSVNPLTSILRKCVYAYTQHYYMQILLTELSTGILG